MKNIVCFGDSITQGQGLAENHRWTARLAFLLEERFPGRFDVFNKGVGGNTTALALDRIQTDVVPLLPAIVLIEFGINDAYVYPWCRTPRVGLKDFRANLEEIIRQVVSQGGHPRLIINHPVTRRRDLHPQGNGKSIASNLRAYHGAVHDVSNAKSVECLNIPELLIRKRIASAGLLAEDGVHLSNQGNRIYAGLAVDHFIRFPRSADIREHPKKDF